ncbi:hypothetical protein CON07_04850, partial [Bacillus sp. AFS094611]|uniref:ATP-binding protein n=1 Tax=Bacillus sp. AFS094611 TaxID=2033516 RepID=UPI000BEE288A
MTTKIFTQEATIQFSPRILSDALGSKIIERDSIAIAEQVKNANDANANKVTIDFSKMYSDDIIEISDNGEGMTSEEIRSKWFLVATNNKEHDTDQLGGKGIGRFSFFRLGDEIKVETTKNGITSSFTLKKEELEKRQTTDNIIINIDQVEVDKNKESGTKISIYNLNSDIDLNEISLDLENLNEPFTTKNFNIIYPQSFNPTKYLTLNKAIQYAPFYVSGEVEGDNLIKYTFKCIFKGKTIYKNEIPTQLCVNNPKNVNIGKIKFEIYNYYFAHWFANKIDIKKTTLQAEFLNAYQGITVYRNSYKIYGHGKEDWLKLAEKRVLKGSESFDNKLTFGYIVLDPKNSTSLEEKTNREGFLRGKVQKYFFDATNTIIDEFNKDRKNAIQKLKKHINTLETSKENKSTTTTENPTNSANTSTAANPTSGANASTTTNPTSGANTSTTTNPTSG